MDDQINVLVVDDDESIRQLMGDILVMLGFKSVVVGDIESCVSTYRRGLSTSDPFDAVILDLNLDGTNRAENWIKEFDSPGGKTRVILSTGAPDDKVAANFKAYGFSDVLIKPYAIRQLRGIMDEIATNKNIL